MRRANLEVKVEVNFVLRGTVHPVRKASLAPRAKEALLADLELPVLSLEDLYGGKLVAALDRQHPRVKAKSPVDVAPARLTPIGVATDSRRSSPPAGRDAN